MATVITQASMSLDGYIADPDRVFRVSAASADYLRRAWANAAAGVASAVAQAKEVAGDRVVSVNPGNAGGQAFQAGLVDELLVDLVPVVFGAGVRYFGDSAGSPLLLGNPEVVQGDRVTHLRYQVRRA